MTMLLAEIKTFFEERTSNDKKCLKENYFKNVKNVFSKMLI